MYSNFVLRLSSIGIFVFVGLFVYDVIKLEFKRNHCESECQEEGYMGFRYVPQHTQKYTKKTTLEKCFCLTQDDLEYDGIPKGVEMY
jgi:hypothetical protein